MRTRALAVSTVACLLGLGLALEGDLSIAQPIRPNVVLILVDDLGWVDTGAYGSTFYETPAIDRLAREGVRFTEFYTASPVCSPTRASLMTGQHPARVGITDWIGGAQRGRLLPAPYLAELPLAHTTVGEAFEQAGYVTGYAGKWHLGTGAFMPERQGFTETIAVNDAGQPTTYFFPYRREQPRGQDVPGLEDGEPGDYLTDRLTDKAIDFIERHHAEPFLLVLAHYAVHTPLEAPDELVARYAAKAGGPLDVSESAFESEGPSFTKLRQDHATYAAMIESTDRSVGRILATLDALNLANDTIVVFVSDNGGLSTLTRRGPGTPTSNAPLRSGKGWLYEGGIRAPLIVRGPGVSDAGRAVAGPAVSMDLYPTLLELARLPLRADQHRDGRSLASMLRGGDADTERTLYWHFPHYHGSGNTPTGAIRAGRYKLIEWFEDGRTELYRLDEDLGERRNLAEVEPRRRDELLSQLRRWRTDVGAKMPTTNPDWRDR